MSKKSMFDIYRDDNDPVVHQIGKLVLTTLGSWLAVKLIETAYNSKFKLNDKDNNA